MIKRYLSIFFLLACWASIIFAQEGKNPFDLPEKSGQHSTPESIERVGNDNPFDLQPSSTSRNRTIQNKDPEVVRSPSITSSNQGVRIGMAMMLIVPLALLLTLFRGVFNDFFESAYRDRKFNQFFRRMHSIWAVPHILFYIYFFLNIALFIHLTLVHYEYDMWGDLTRSIGILSISVAIFFLCKHAIVYFLGNAFDVTNESKRYSLLILTFNIILGVFLTPINLLILLGPESLKGIIVVVGLLLCGAIILLLIARSLSVSNRLLLQHSLHFFMYLCAIEIAPLFIVAKLLT